MKCPRCGKRNPGASWYCAKCGSPLTDLNTADAAGPGRFELLRRWGLLAVGIVVLAGVIAGLVASGALERLSRGPGEASDPGAEIGAGFDDSLQAGFSGPTIVARAPAPATQRIVTPVPTSRVRPGARPWTAPRLAEPPVVDGRLDEWWWIPIVVASVVYGSEHWDGPDDLGGKAHAAWDDRALYLAVQVTDDEFSQPSTGRQLYLGDSLEVQIDADLDGDWTDDSYNGDDWQIGLSPGDLDGRSPEAYVWRPVARPADAIEVAARLLAGGYVVEAAIPWPLLGVNPHATRGLGVALNISDNDSASPDQESMISSSPARAWADPRTFGTLILGEHPPE